MTIHDRIKMGRGITFPTNDGDAESVSELIEDAYEFIAGFPVPLFEMTCFCGSNQFHILSYNYFMGAITESAEPYRCCMNYVCRGCSAVHDHRLVISKEIFDLRSNDRVAFMYRWRDALDIMERAGY